MNIREALEKILHAVYGREVRQAIHDGIKACYDDGRAGAIDLQAREDIETINNALDLKLDPALVDIEGLKRVVEESYPQTAATAYEAKGRVVNLETNVIPAMQEQLADNSSVIDEHKVRLSLLNAHIRLDQVDITFWSGIGTHIVNLSSWNTETIHPIIVPILNQDNIIWWINDGKPSNYTIKFKNLTTPNFNGTVKVRIMFVGSV